MLFGSLTSATISTGLYSIVPGKEPERFRPARDARLIHLREQELEFVRFRLIDQEIEQLGGVLGMGFQRVGNGSHDFRSVGEVHQNVLFDGKGARAEKVRERGFVSLTMGVGCLDSKARGVPF
jgi:hypothetical protein